MGDVYSQATQTQEAIAALESSSSGACRTGVEGEVAALISYKERITAFLEAVEASITDPTAFAKAERLNLRLDDGLFEAAGAAGDACFPA